MYRRYSFMHGKLASADNRRKHGPRSKPVKAGSGQPESDLEIFKRLHFFFTWKEYVVFILCFGVGLALTALLDFIFGSAISIWRVPLFQWSIFIICMSVSIHILGIATKLLVKLSRRLLPFEYYHWTHGWQKTLQWILSVVVYEIWAFALISEVRNGDGMGQNLAVYVKVLLEVLAFNVIKILVFKFFDNSWKTGKLGDELGEAIFFSWALRRLYNGKYFGLHKAFSSRGNFGADGRPSAGTGTGSGVEMSVRPPGDREDEEEGTLPLMRNEGRPEMDLNNNSEKAALLAEIENFDASMTSVSMSDMTTSHVAAGVSPNRNRSYVFAGGSSGTSGSEDSGLRKLSPCAEGCLSERIATEAMRDRDESMVVTRRIMAATDQNHSGVLTRGTLDDLLGSKEHTEHFMQAFVEPEADSISTDELQSGICAILEHRRAVSRALKAQKDATNIVQSVMNIFFWVVMFFFVLSQLGYDFFQLVVPITGFFFLIGFGLGPLISNAALALNLCLTRRVFDVGDIITVNDGLPMYVEQIRLWDSFFFRMNGEALYLPNASLAAAQISNMKRSHQAVIDLFITLNLETTQPQIDAFTASLAEWVGTQPQSLWASNYLCCISDLPKGQDTDQSFQLHVQGFLKVTWQERADWQREKSRFALFVTDALGKAGIKVLNSGKKVD
eukprot:ANDGO_07851.mRNA.1 Mechanosensitive ion channel protein 10